MAELAVNNWSFDNLPGINPTKWPIDLDTLFEKLEALPQLSLFNEPMEFHTQFFSKCQEFIYQQIQDAKEDEALKNLLLAVKVYISIALQTGNFLFLMNILQLVHEIETKLPLETKCQFFQEVSEFIKPKFQAISSLNSKKPQLHYLSSLCNAGSFIILDVKNFQKQTFQTTSITTCGKFLYIYISGNNGGMFKVGTGEEGTLPGKIYHYCAVTKAEDVAWVYCKEKLYLRVSSKELGTIEILDAATFKSEQVVQLFCPEIFRHPQLQTLNKGFPLLSDGNGLYIIGKNLISEKISTQFKGNLKQNHQKGWSKAANNEKRQILKQIQQDAQLQLSQREALANFQGNFQQLAMQEGDENSTLMKKCAVYDLVCKFVLNIKSFVAAKKE
eukprot:TRINITY_DN1623_c0_g1_i4.p1 TRINITY_DN1623_c0_g1~~TRINITY_DN1623_c0_g1_i4.p1  ORF type:complete len:387 (+),score=62.79 TRINITY_DN1623_c0_g1_i4:339-1499(+)